MTISEIPAHRLQHQLLSQTKFSTPSEVVTWFGAVQAQDYLGSLWALGLRMEQAVENDIDQAIKNREIVRTWPMRGTLHFVAADDIRWMLKLMTPRVIRGADTRYRQLGLDEAIFTKSAHVLTNALAGGKILTRTALYEVLQQAQIDISESRGLHILGKLSMEGRICLGSREGKQPTFTLLDEWIPKSKELAGEEALGEIALRYFQSHGPATLQDFVWWSGLTVKEARTGIELVKTKFEHETIDNAEYWFGKTGTESMPKGIYTHLLPAFDEYTVAYKFRETILDPQFSSRLNAGGGMLNPVIVINGFVKGTWKRTIKKNNVQITLFPFTPLHKEEKKAIHDAATRYGDFLGLPVALA